jgi:uncharacterized membrane protein
MSSNNDHIRKTFLTGMFAAVPLAVTIYVVYVINGETEKVTLWLFGRNIPLLGLVMALGSIYFIGMIANSLLGRFFLRRIDVMISHVPFVRQIYLGWKQIALTPGGTEGTFSKVVLIPDETGLMKWLGFTSGRAVDGPDAEAKQTQPMYCVWVPNSPNPLTGRLYFVPVEKCTMLSISVEEAFKVILSTGNYVPPLLAAANGGQPVLTETRG